ncbi:hypothetical protein BCE75_10668 [Isoptericola sp. CG 20/1183]|uniref:Uncharacterized protein n=1 Tax=Isoptericola halotolerans TaxID=300560 RepID=A0ABX5EHK5_9MICO|nr:hypothetical protein BCL65_106166 [Isoptericola halotolerans]PRZ06703.1 hypothetical protein BCE75_10668 [Isoptericola sp. CG 20/1183]
MTLILAPVGPGGDPGHGRTDVTLNAHGVIFLAGGRPGRWFPPRGIAIGPQVTAAGRLVSPAGP